MGASRIHRYATKEFSPTVRLTAVGVVGVKIAATGNEMIYEVMAHTLADLSHASTTDIILVPVMFIGWITPGPDFAPSIGYLQSNITL